MSLATSGVGGAGAGGGMSMGIAAHGGPSALTTHQQATGGRAGAGPPPGTTAAPANAAALGADQLDKNQNLNWRQINKTAEMPIVAVDLYGDRGDVAYYPSVVGEEQFGSPDDWIKTKHVGSGSCLVMKKDDEASYKALRRLLSKSKGHETVFSQSCSTLDKKGDESAEKISIPSPQLLLGARRVKQLHKATVSKYVMGKESKHAIDEDGSSSGANGLTIQNGNLDGSNNEQDNDFDRVTFNLKLVANKKTLTLLPEDAVGILVAKAKHSVHKSTQGDGDDDDDSEFLKYPPAFALPAWACFDNTIDSLMDACQGTNPVLYQRSVAALAGALLPRVVIHEKKQKLKNVALYDVIMKKMKDHEKKTQVAQQQKKPLPNQSYSPMVIMAGITDDGLELTAIEVKGVNPSFMQNDCHVPFQEFKVISSVAYHHSNPLSLVQSSFCMLTDNIDEICPELEDDGGIAAIVTYGTIEKQLKMKEAITKTLKGIEDDEVWNPKITFQSSKEEAVAMGTSILAAVSHARIEKPSVTIKNVSPTAVGLSYNFDGGKEGSSWSDPKIIFDYDRRVPAGPSKTEFSAAECVALKKDLSLFDDMEKLVEESQKWSKGKYNNVREEAALNLCVRVMQRVERNGDWKQIGCVMTPLTKDNDTSDDGNDEGSKFAIETSTLELSLDSVGSISAEFCSDGQSIEQALKSAKSSTFWKYFRIILAIGFFGGFFIKSFVEDRIRERDVKRLLAFYKHVVPGSINDGDRNNAYYLCWKYKGKKNKLWKRLETKYGAPVLTLKEYEELEEEAEAAAKAEAEKQDDDENLDFDDEDNTQEEL